MNLMLAVIFVCIALGLLAPRIGRREQLAVVVIAVAMTSLYFFTRRFIPEPRARMKAVALQGMRGLASAVCCVRAFRA